MLGKASDSFYYFQPLTYDDNDRAFFTYVTVRELLTSVTYNLMVYTKESHSVVDKLSREVSLREQKLLLSTTNWESVAGAFWRSTTTESFSHWKIPLNSLFSPVWLYSTCETETAHGALVSTGISTHFSLIMYAMPIITNFIFTSYFGYCLDWH